MSPVHDAELADLACRHPDRMPGLIFDLLKILGEDLEVADEVDDLAAAQILCDQLYRTFDGRRACVRAIRRVAGLGAGSVPNPTVRELGRTVEALNMEVMDMWRALVYQRHDRRCHVLLSEAWLDARVAPGSVSPPAGDASLTRRLNALVDVVGGALGYEPVRLRLRKSQRRVDYVASATLVDTVYVIAHVEPAWRGA